MSRVATIAGLALAMVAAPVLTEAEAVFRTVPKGWTPITGRYGVKLSKGVSTDSVLDVLGAEAAARYVHVFNGFSAYLNDRQLALLLKTEGVEVVEEEYYHEYLTPAVETDKEVNDVLKYLQRQEGRESNVSEEGNVRVQKGTPNWGLDRMDQNELPLDDEYNFEYAGRGTHMWVMDTGGWPYHQEFEHRWSTSYDGLTGVERNEAAYDCHGHGTHVGGLASGSTIGAAKESVVHFGKVQEDCALGAAIAATETVEWILASYLELGKPPSVINYSYGTGTCDGPAPCDLFETAVLATINEGMHFFFAAGNSNIDSCNYPGIRLDESVTIGSMTIDDEKSSFSNYGPCVDIFAPGSLTLSSVPPVYASSVATGRVEDFNQNGVNADPDYTIISGTSMASPMAAGAATVYLEAQPDLTPAELKTLFLANGARDQLSGIDNLDLPTPNLLVQTRFDMDELIKIVRPEPEAEADEDAGAEGAAEAASAAAAVSGAQASGSASSASAGVIAGVSAAAVLVSGVSVAVAVRAQRKLNHEMTKSKMAAAGQA